MMRLALGVVFVAMVACGSDEPTPNDVLDCDSASWAPEMLPSDQCARACVTKPDNFRGTTQENACTASTPDVEGVLVTCDRTFVYEGVRGCCSIREPAGAPVRFYTCE